MRSWKDPWGMQAVMQPRYPVQYMPPQNMTHVVYAANYHPHPQVRQLARFILSQNHFMPSGR